MARSKYAASGAEDEDVNVTPLLDIVFIMLIFFIVTSTFVKEPGVDIQRPEATTATDRKFATILVGIDQENRIFINKDEVELDAVRLAIEGLKRENPKGTAAIQVDARADTELLVQVTNQIRAAGVNDIAVSTEDR